MGEFLDSLSEGFEYLTDQEGVEARKREDDSYQRFVSFMEDKDYGPDKMDQDFFNRRFTYDDPQNFQKFLDRYNAQQAQTKKIFEVNKKIKENPDYTPPLTEEQQKLMDYGIPLERVLDMTGGYISEVTGESWGGSGSYNTGGRVGFQGGGMGYKDIVERFAEGLTDREFIEFEMMSPDQQMEVMKRAGVMRDDMNIGGRVGLALGGEPDPYMEDYRDKVIRDPILEPGDEMMPDDEQGIVSMLQDEQDPERKVMLAIQIIQSMGDRGIEIVQSILSPEEIAMAVQVIQQMDTGADQGIDSIQMAAEGGRIGFQDGGDDYQSPPFIDDPAGTFDTDPMELREMIESEGTLKTASSMGDVFMQAMEDSSVLELDSWLMKYQPFGLREDDYFNFRTMGPQARGPEATEGLATLRV